MQDGMSQFMFDNNENDFTGEEITAFKRYIEENNVYTENNFEFLEENLQYYSSRYTREGFISPFEFFQSNSNYIVSNEMMKNEKLYESSIEWYSKTVHPEDSEYVIKEEKYIYVNSLDNCISKLIDKLNNYSKEDYQCVDILIYYKKSIYKYLPQKNFVFTWRKDCKKVFDSLFKNNFYQNKEKMNSVEIHQPVIIFPIFIPIRQSLFLGEFGYRNAMVKYGGVIERIMNINEKLQLSKNLDRFDNSCINNLLGIDGVEKSIYNILVFSEGDR